MQALCLTTVHIINVLCNVCMLSHSSVFVRPVNRQFVVLDKFCYFSTGSVILINITINSFV